MLLICNWGWLHVSSLVGLLSRGFGWIIVGFTLELHVKCKCTWNLLWVWRSKMYLLQLYLVTMETFVIQRSRTLKYGLHHTWEHTWPIRNGSHVHVQRFQDSNERRDWQLVLQVIYFVNKCEAMFYTEWLKISKCTWIKFLLESNFASSVKPTTDSLHFKQFTLATSVKPCFIMTEWL